MQVDLVRTPCSVKQFAAAFIGAWRTLTGVFPSKESCAVVYAQWMTETSGREFWCFNVGNSKVTQAQVDAGVPWYDLPGTWEIIAGKRVVLPAGHPGRRFRAFASLEQGMREHLELLRRRFSACWPSIEAGDPEAFTHAIKAGRDGIEGTNDDYFTAPVDAYLRLMRPNYERFRNMPAFDDAYHEAIAAIEAETQPEIRVVDFPIVHPPVPLGDDDPDDAA